MKLSILYLLKLILDCIDKLLSKLRLVCLMPIPKDSKLRLPAYIAYYSTLAVIVVCVVITYFFSSFPLSANQLFVIFLANAGGYGIVEELAKANKDSTLGKNRSILILSLLAVIVVILICLFAFSINITLTVIGMVVVDCAFWGSLWLINWRSKKVQATFNVH